MPEMNGIGFSEYTKNKQECFADVLDSHLAISSVITERYPYISGYYFYDLTAGCGHNPENNKEKGSPAIFIEKLSSFKAKHQKTFIKGEMFERISGSQRGNLTGSGLKTCLFKQEWLEQKFILSRT